MRDVDSCEARSASITLDAGGVLSEKETGPTFGSEAEAHGPGFSRATIPGSEIVVALGVEGQGCAKTSNGDSQEILFCVHVPDIGTVGDAAFEIKPHQSDFSLGP